MKSSRAGSVSEPRRESYSPPINEGTRRVRRYNRAVGADESRSLSRRKESAARIVAIRRAVHAGVHASGALRRDRSFHRRAVLRPGGDRGGLDGRAGAARGDGADSGPIGGRHGAHRVQRRSEGFRRLGARDRHDVDSFCDYRARRDADLRHAVGSIRRDYANASRGGGIRSAIHFRRRLRGAVHHRVQYRRGDLSRSRRLDDADGFCRDRVRFQHNRGLSPRSGL